MGALQFCKKREQPEKHFLNKEKLEGFMKLQTTTFFISNYEKVTGMLSLCEQVFSQMLLKTGLDMAAGVVQHLECSHDLLLARAGSSTISQEKPHLNQKGKEDLGRVLGKFQIFKSLLEDHHRVSHKRPDPAAVP